MESEPWAVFFHDIVSNYGIGWAVTAVAAFLILSRLDFVKRIFVERHRIEADREDRVSEETLRLIDNLRADAEAQREWRIRDTVELKAHYEQVLADLREQNKSLTNSVELSQKGNARLRHSLQNSFAWGQALYVKCLSAGMTAAPLRLDELLEMDPDLGQKMREVLEEGEKIAARRRLEIEKH